MHKALATIGRIAHFNFVPILASFNSCKRIRIREIFTSKKTKTIIKLVTLAKVNSGKAREKNKTIKPIASVDNTGVRVTAEIDWNILGAIF